MVKGCTSSGNNVKSMAFVNVFCHLKNYRILNVFNVHCGKWMFCSVIFACVTQRRWHDGSCPEVKWDDGLWWKNDVVMPIFAHISYSFPFIEENQSQFLFFKFPFCIFFSYHSPFFFLKIALQWFSIQLAQAVLCNNISTP